MAKNGEKGPHREFEVIEDELNHIFPDTFIQAGPHAEDLSSVHRKVHEHSRRFKPLSALCLSGGGIRSATFCLGVLQALGRECQLDKFHYLSTVSGGGYIGSWLSRWRRGKGAQEVFEGLAGRGAGDKLGSEPLPVRNLRSFSNFIAPRWSADTWTLVVLYLRNLFLNWLILVPLLFAVLLLPRLNLLILNLPEMNPYASWGAAIFLALTVVFVGKCLPMAGNDRFKNAIFHKSCPWVLCLAAYLLVLDWAFSSGTGKLPYGQYCAGALEEIAGWLFGEGVPRLGYHLISAVWTATTAVSLVMLWILYKFFKGWRSGLSKRTVAILATWLGMIALLVVNSHIIWPALNPFRDLRLLATLAVPAALISYSLVATIWVGIAALASSEADREWWAASCGTAMAIAFGWFCLHAMVFYLPVVLLRLGARFTLFLAGLGGVAGILTAVGGYFSRRSPPGKAGGTSNIIKEFLGKWGLNLCALLFIILNLGVGGSLLTAHLCSRLFPQAIVENLDMNTFVDNSGGGFALTAQQVDRLVSRVTQELKKIEGEPNRRLAAAEAALEKEANELLQKAARNELRGLDTESGRKAISVHARLEDKAQRYEAGLIQPQSIYLWPAWLGLLIAALGLSRLFGVNRFSLHSVYGNRLVRAYLGAFRSNEKRRKESDPLTGFDEKDNVCMWRLLFRNAKKQNGDQFRSNCLFHVVNATLNLVGGDRLEWQERKGSSFTISPLHAGSWSLKDDDNQEKGGRYQPVQHYGGKSPISLGRAMAISGAAVSPNMGYHSSRLVACVMTFFNLRLGWWLPNPAQAGRKAWQRNEPKIGIFPLVREALGKTTSNSPFVHLSDGGHFDNLGLYEMVRRRCRRILAVDASADPGYSYDDLSNTIRKIRADMGVSIEFLEDWGLPPRGEAPTKSFAIGRIRYSDVDLQTKGRDSDKKPISEEDGDERNGILIYLKPVVNSDAPTDVKQYSALHREGQDCFPHQSTADQFFDESQFESYRMLGMHLGMQAMKHIGRWEGFGWEQIHEMTREKPTATVLGKEENHSIIGDLRPDSAPMPPEAVRSLNRKKRILSKISTYAIHAPSVS